MRDGLRSEFIGSRNKHTVPFLRHSIPDICDGKRATPRGTGDEFSGLSPISVALQSQSCWRCGQQAIVDQNELALRIYERDGTDEGGLAHHRSGGFLFFRSGAPGRADHGTYGERDSDDGSELHGRAN